MKLSSRSRKIGLLALSLVAVGLTVTLVLRSRRPVPQEAPLPPDVQAFSGPIVQAGDFRLSGPYAHANLTVFLIHGTDQWSGSDLLTLQDALEQNKAVVHETGSVNELSVENTSAGEEVYIQSGDIVKGGQQDRTLHYDMIVSPQSGKVPLASFCVEQGRWSARGEEKFNLFMSSRSSLSSKELKLANRYEANQSKVWDKVAVAQRKLSDNVGQEVRSVESASSLVLTLENSALDQAVQPYLETLTGIGKDEGDTIGYVFAINGQLNSAEVYGTSHLFRRLWPKLLRASAVEAVAEKQGTEARATPSEAAVRAWLRDAEAGKAYLRPVGDRTSAVQQEGEKCLLFETRDRKRGEAWVHRTYLAK
jgi:hypothetical protein